MNKNAFILYDALVSFVMLASMMLMVNKMLLINHQFEKQITIDHNAIEYLRKNIYEKTYYHTSNDMTFNSKNRMYCVTYEREICVSK